MSARKMQKLPTWTQLRHLPKLLSPLEKKISLAGVALLLIGGLLLGLRLWNTNRSLVPAVGGEYTEGLVGTPQLINPIYAISSDVDMDLERLIFSGLMKFDPEQGLVPDLAESYQISNDHKIYTFTLRDDARWHDGTPVKADDVVFTISAIQNREYRSPLFVSWSGVAVEQIDERTVRFTLSEPFAPFLSLTVVGLLPAHIWQDVNPANAELTELNKKPIGSGPFQFEKLAKDAKGTIKNYTLKRNADFYGGAPYIEQLHFKFYSDNSEALNALKNRQVEGMGFVPLEETAALSHDRDLQLIFPSLPEYTAVFFNQKRQPNLTDALIREALTLATDKDAILQKALFGHGQSINSFILPSAVGYYPDVKKINFDLPDAQDRLESAGWLVPEGGSIRKKGDAQLSLELVTLNTPELVATANELRSQWALAGIELNVKIVSAAQFQNEILKNRSYDMVLSGELYGIDPDPYAFWHSSQANYPGLNLAQYANRKSDEAIEKGRSTTNNDERATAYQELQTQVVDSLSAIFLYQPSYSYAITKKVQGIDLTRIVVPADRFANANTWYLKTKKVFKTTEVPQ
jgi:peptide/nickel transport system substrate-binding protein